MVFLSLVIVHAPDGFPKEDYLRADEQLTLKHAFKELRDGMVFVVSEISNDGVLGTLRGQLDQSLALYRQGDDVKSAHYVAGPLEQILVLEAGQLLLR